MFGSCPIMIIIFHIGISARALFDSTVESAKSTKKPTLKVKPGSREDHRLVRSPPPQRVFKPKGKGKGKYQVCYFVHQCMLLFVCICPFRHHVGTGSHGTTTRDGEV